MTNRIVCRNTFVALLALLLAACGGGGGGDGAATTDPALPQVSTRALEAVTEDGATVCGAIDPNGSEAVAWFEWGTDPALANPAETEHVALGSGADPVALTADLTGLTTGVTYYYRAVASSSAGIQRGAVECFGLDAPDTAMAVVNSLEDTGEPALGKMTLRAALDGLASGGTITFAPSLDGRTIALSLVGAEHSALKGEVFRMSQGRWEFLGFQERDYGRSALYVDRDVTIDASNLPRGITLAWAGGDESPARVLAVSGNLTLRNVTVSSGCARSEPIEGGSQPHTLARGGGLAVWGVAKLERCTVSGNRVEGDLGPSRDRGAFGGGIYANSLVLHDCVVSGNSASGFGAAGGGVYSVGGADDPGQGSALIGCSITGNRVTGQHAYGGGVYTDGGGPGNLLRLELRNCTVARNAVEDHPGIAESAMFQYYYRGGGIYMSNGYLALTACTIAENEVTGNPTEFNGKPNMGGGGVAATIGNAHVVEDIELAHSLVVGNRVNGEDSDLFTGSLLHFYSWGYNAVGVIDFSQMLVPIPEWMSLSRRHWPKVADREGVGIVEVLDVDGARAHPSIVSRGTDGGRNAVLWYPPLGGAVDQIPLDAYDVQTVLAEYVVEPEAADDFLDVVLERLRTEYAYLLGSDFGSSWDDLSGVTFHGPAGDWPSNPENNEWIGFWHGLDEALGGRFGAVGLGDDFWSGFGSGPWGNALVTSDWVPRGPFRLTDFDQRGTPRPQGRLGDLGAVELDIAPF